MIMAAYSLQIKFRINVIPEDAAVEAEAEVEVGKWAVDEHLLVRLFWTQAGKESQWFLQRPRRLLRRLSERTDQLLELGLGLDRSER